jgi:hypothetical protein
VSYEKPTRAERYWGVCYGIRLMELEVASSAGIAGEKLAWVGS